MANGTRFSASALTRPNDRIDVPVKFPKVMPSLGVGWGSQPAAAKGWGVAFELGLSIGKPRVSGQASGPLLSNAAVRRTWTDRRVHQGSRRHGQGHRRGQRFPQPAAVRRRELWRLGRDGSSDLRGDFQYERQHAGAAQRLARQRDDHGQERLQLGRLGALVKGDFTVGGTGLSCTAGTTGVCSIRRGTLGKSVTFTIFNATSVTGTNLTYDAPNSVTTVTVLRF